MKQLLKNKQYEGSTIFHYTDRDSAKRANSALLMGAFEILEMKRTSEEVIQRWADVKFRPYRDASHKACTYKCTVKYIYFFIKRDSFLIASWLLEGTGICSQAQLIQYENIPLQELWVLPQSTEWRYELDYSRKVSSFFYSYGKQSAWWSKFLFFFQIFQFYQFKKI